METETLAPGAELDRLVAERVFERDVLPFDKRDLSIGYYLPSDDGESWEPLPPYSTDVAAAWSVVEHMRELDYTTDIRLGSNDRQAWVHMIGRDWKHPNAQWLADSAPEAICRAALAALAATDPERRP